MLKWALWLAGIVTTPHAHLRHLPQTVWKMIFQKRQLPRNKLVFMDVIMGHSNASSAVFPGASLAYWGPGWNNGAAIAASQRPEIGIPNPVPWIPQPMFAPPTYCAPAIPFPVMPAPYWPCMSGWPNGAWSVPWSGPNSDGAYSGNDSPVLGKHSRDGSLQEEEKSEKSLWIPKTLKIHDPTRLQRAPYGQRWVLSLIYP
ncbi:cyclic dof factor 3-like [Iris pallida]|uniref:Cyclic dof factor 3-like n=1 Tax=Iris pallida TaxID=29817 RepID=A0AAX6GMF4_IRIPA|nr:cyclic dof factor 3-like [Iris pallida]